MKIRLLSFCFNEEAILPYFFRHYDTFVDKYIIYDNNSTDGSIEYLKKKKNVDLRFWDTKEKIDLLKFTDIRNNVWLENKEEWDWQIVCDIDEFLYHDNIIQLLEEYKNKGITIPAISGYQMVSKKFPITKKQIYDEIKTGCKIDVLFNFPATLFDKSAIFDLNKVQLMNYGLGAHHIKPTGIVKHSSRKDIKLLHYKYLGLDYIKEHGKSSLARVNEPADGQRRKHYNKLADFEEKQLNKWLELCEEVI